MSNKFTNHLKKSVSLIAVAAVVSVGAASVTIAQSSKSQDAEKTQATDSRSTMDKSSKANAASRNDQSDASSAQTAQSDTQAPQNVTLVRASKLVGKQFGGKAGEKYGDIEYLLIEPTSGKVVFAMMGTGGWLNANQELIAVPLEAIEFKGSDENMQMRLSTDKANLENAPRINQSTLTELTQPVAVERVYNYWSEVDPNMRRPGESSDRSQPSGTDQSARTDDQRSASNTTDQTTGPEEASNKYERTGKQSLASNRSDDATTRSGDQQSASNTASESSGSDADKSQSASNLSSDVESPGAQTAQNMSPNPTQERNAEARGNRQASDSNAGQQKTAGQSQSGQSRDGKTYALVGRDYVATLLPPVVSTAQKMRGATLKKAGTSEEIGQVEDLVIDMDRGYVSYALIEHGGFLGIGSSLAPVPFQKMTLSANETFTADVEKGMISEGDMKVDMTEPSKVKVSDLKTLYDKFGTKPHWEQTSARSAGTAESGDETSGSMSKTDTKSMSKSGAQSEKDKTKSSDTK
jgi:uncharacterized protein YrrD